MNLLEAGANPASEEGPEDMYILHEEIDLHLM